MPTPVVLADQKAREKWSDIKAQLQAMKGDDCDWAEGKVPGYTYKMGDDLDYVIRESYQMYFGENALGKNAFKSVVKLESAVVDFCLRLFGHDHTGAGIFTSGGTESIFLAVKSAREWAKRNKPNVDKPNIVMPVSAHAAFGKATYYMGLESRRVPIGFEYRADLNQLREAIDENTIMIVGSAPAYAHGNFDDIGSIGELAEQHGLWLHVDACLGGFVAPFAKKLGYPIPKFDFTVPQVTSLSADLHKYGYAPKGSSVLLYRTPDHKEYAKFVFRDWPRGLYQTYTFLGSRPAGPLAGSFAALNFLGEQGYINATRIMLSIKEKLISGIEAIGGLRVYHPSDLIILLYDSVEAAVDINAVAEEMRKRGWFIGVVANPVAISFPINPIHEKSVDLYVADLRSCVEIVRKSGKTAAYDEATYT
ncbi:pyridoxal phosphate-dependent decarboxylase family protein [Ensifer aridi]|uniref:pyridoxal phosphate-dependent decarboxylase family protein n=1 Tax=Ensifer aridi TaxID=1708715 RepID=UPI000A0FAAB3|nr:aspartate aminotransferase family protein [Ensifer aridi]